MQVGLGYNNYCGGMSERFSKQKEAVIWQNNTR